jgi:hypothetical protein
MTADCEQLDSTRCLLPWPSNTFTRLDATTPTGLRVAVNPHSLPVLDRPDALTRTDGFSVVSPLIVGFPTPVAPTVEGTHASTAVHLYLEQPGDGFGEEVPVRTSVVLDDKSQASLVIAYPLRPLRYASDYVAVVLDEVKAADGSSYAVEHPVQVALGLVKPVGDAEAQLAAYHAPTRALLGHVGVDLAHVLKAWDFTTRSEAGVTRPLLAMRAAVEAAVDAGTVSFTIESADLFGNGAALDVRGHLTDVPTFVNPDGGAFTFDDTGLPVRTGTHAPPYRAVVPTTRKPWPVVVFGHGTGGTVNDDTFDTEIVAAGAGKLNLEFDGWTSSTAAGTLVSFTKLYTGIDRSTERLMQSLADAAGVEALLAGPLGAALSADAIEGHDNPAKGQRPDLSKLTYAGGSLGGTLGYVHSLIDPKVHVAVLNVPGAAWTHFVAKSVLIDTLGIVYASTIPSALDRALGIASTQNAWDWVDGAAWAPLTHRTDQTFLLQESIGDPVLPNIGGAMVAVSSGATQVGVVLDPLLGLPQANQTSGHTAITQYKVPASVTSDYGIHGFAAGDSVAGVAAREQISRFITSAWNEGTPVIEVPPTCLARPSGTCDFSAP